MFSETPLKWIPPVPQNFLLLQPAFFFSEAKLSLLRPLPISDLPWKIMSMDFIYIVGLPPPEGFTSVFVVIDQLSKMSKFVPLVGTPSAVDMAHAFMKKIVRLHGLPRSIVSDRGVQFTSKFWRTLCKY